MSIANKTSAPYLFLAHPSFLLDKDYENMIKDKIRKNEQRI